jgi:hypothetical protein
MHLDKLNRRRVIRKIRLVCRKYSFKKASGEKLDFIIDNTSVGEGQSTSETNKIAFRNEMQEIISRRYFNQYKWTVAGTKLSLSEILGILFLSIKNSDKKYITQEME